MKKGLVLVSMITILALMLSGCAKKLTEEELYAKVTNLIENEKWEELIDTYKEIIDSYPESPNTPETAYELGQVYASNFKDFQKAIDVWQKLVADYPDHQATVIKAKFLIGYTYANEIKDYEKARESYTAFLQEYPEDGLAPSVEWELQNLGVDPDAMMFESNQEK